MSEFIAEWVEKSFGMTAMMPSIPYNAIQADVTIISSKNGAKSMNDTYQQMQDQFTATDIPLSTQIRKPEPDQLQKNHLKKVLLKERKISRKATRRTSCIALILYREIHKRTPTTFLKLYKFTNIAHSS